MKELFVVRLLSIALVASRISAAQLEPEVRLPAPAGFVRVSPCVASMEVHKE